MTVRNRLFAFCVASVMAAGTVLAAAPPSAADVASIVGDPPSARDTQRAADAVLTAFDRSERTPMFSTYSSSARGYGTHGGGMAADTWPGTDYHLWAVIERGNAIAEFAKENAAALGIFYIVWRNRIWSPARASEGWRPTSVPDSADDTTKHMNHIHLGTTDDQGTWRGGPLKGLAGPIVSARAANYAAWRLGTAPDSLAVFGALHADGLYPYVATTDRWTVGRVAAMKKFEQTLYGASSAKADGRPDAVSLNRLRTAAHATYEIVS